MRDNTSTTANGQTDVDVSRLIGVGGFTDGEAREDKEGEVADTQGPSVTDGCNVKGRRQGEARAMCEGAPGFGPFGYRAGLSQGGGGRDPRVEDLEVVLHSLSKTFGVNTALSKQTNEEAVGGGRVKFKGRVRR